MRSLQSLLRGSKLSLFLLTLIIVPHVPATPDVSVNPANEGALQSISHLAVHVPREFLSFSPAIPLHVIPRELLTLITGSPAAIGAYSPSLKIIYIAGEHNTPRVVVHEWGHVVWFNVLTRVEREEFFTIWKLHKRYGLLLTRYAATNHIEGFAETFYKVYVDKTATPLETHYLERVRRRIHGGT